MAMPKATPTHSTAKDTHCHDGPVRIVGHARLAALVTALGTGYTAWQQWAVTRWRPDRFTAPLGTFIYLRDCEQEACWSATRLPRLPVSSVTSFYTCRGTPQHVTITRETEQIRSELEVAVVDGEPLELRRVTLTNESSRTRHLEVTTYTELVLQSAVDFEAHPAFSKLFVETGFDSTRCVLRAKRRRRFPGERTLSAATFLVDLDGGPLRDLSFETDRARFLGRGRGVASPQAVLGSSVMSGTIGGVLDPIFSWRTSITLPPHASRSFVLALAADTDTSRVDALVEWFQDPDRVTRAMADAAAWNGPGDAPPCPCESAIESIRQRLGNRISISPAQVDWRCDMNMSLAPGKSNGAVPGHGAPSPEGTRSERPPSPYGVMGTDRSSADGAVVSDLQFPNGWGGFHPNGAEYVIELKGDDAGNLHLPPRSWTHIVANPQCGFLTSERGATCTWAGNSRENRLTPWYNDPVSDPFGEALYLRDQESRIGWSLLPGPIGQATDYQVRYGFGYATFRHTSQGLEQQVTMFVPRRDPLRIVKITIANRSDRTRRLRLYSYARWVLGDDIPPEGAGIATEWDAARQVLMARRSRGRPFDGHVAFASLHPCAEEGTIEFTSDGESFFGPFGGLERPSAVSQDLPLDGRVGDPPDACAALSVSLAVAPGEEVHVVSLLGQGADVPAVQRLVGHYRALGSVHSALDEVTEGWRHCLATLTIQTPSASLNWMVNGWLPYQNLTCRLWGRSSSYQGGGAFGFRDQLQDSLAFLHLDPDIPRRQILLHAAHQFREGDVLHWWHPPESAGVRTRFSDDLLWLPFACLEYTHGTGDTDIWDQIVPYREGPQLADGEQERFMRSCESEEAGTIYEHCCRALDRSRAVGSHGLPLMGSGDWNDGMSRVGAQGRGESVWLAFFLCGILDRFLPVCRHRGDHDRAEEFSRWREQLVGAIESHGWDGRWYRRAFLDNGQPLGSQVNRECRIDALVQAWSVLSRAACPERARAAMDEAYQQLVSEPDGIVRLLTPPFDSEELDVGYIRGYVAGVRENGGQYTHGAVWYLRALAELGDTTRTARLLESLTPIWHTSTPERVQTYQAEPYVLAADVYGEPPHTGKAGWTWYTGSAGWMYRTIVESLLGFQVVGGSHLQIRPRISVDWPEFSLRYQRPHSGTAYVVRVIPLDGTMAGAARAELDGHPLPLEGDVVRVPLAEDGRVHSVLIMAPADAAPTMR